MWLFLLFTLIFTMKTNVLFAEHEYHRTSSDRLLISTPNDEVQVFGDSVVQVVHGGDGLLTVQVRPISLIPQLTEKTNCDPSSDTAANRFIVNHFAMHFKDSSTLEDTCIWEKSDVDLCSYKKTLVLPCDPETFTASVDMYWILDRSGILTKSNTVSNPYVGRCFDPLDDVIPRSMHHRATFHCARLEAYVTEKGKHIYDMFPPTCAHIRKKDPTAQDGEYTVWYHGTTSNKAAAEGEDSQYIPLSLYCHNMQQSSSNDYVPAEYISLVYPTNNYATANMSTVSNVPIVQKAQQRTTFEKIRFDPQTLKVNIADFTFSSTNNLEQDVTPWWQHDYDVPYGVAMNCNSYESFAKIDLRGTQFKVADVSDVLLWGHHASGELKSYDENHQLILLSGGGYCGGISLSGHDPGFLKNRWNAAQFDEWTQKYHLQLALL